MWVSLSMEHKRHLWVQLPQLIPHQSFIIADGVNKGSQLSSEHSERNQWLSAGVFSPGTHSLWYLYVLFMSAHWISLGTLFCPYWFEEFPAGWKVWIASRCVRMLFSLQGVFLTLAQRCWKRLRPPPDFHKWRSPEADGRFKVTVLLFVMTQSIDNSCQAQWINVKVRLFECHVVYLHNNETKGNGLELFYVNN